MNTENKELRGRNFRTNQDYARALHDNRIIEGLLKKLDKNNPQNVSELRFALEEGKYKFESILGEDFIEEIVELDMELRRNPPINTKKSKGLRGKNASVNTIDESKAKGLEDYDEDMRSRIIKEMKRSRIRHNIILSILVLCILGSIGYLIFYYTLYEKNDIEYEELAQIVEEDVGGTIEINYDEAKDKPPILKKYETLYKKNRKLVGWLKIDGCDIDYPVMQTSNNDYYLDHNYNQDYDKNGSIFMDKDCTPAFPNDNMIIYGHHMKSGKMFGNLNYYAKESFWEKNKEFTFDTIYETGTYEVMYVFRSKIYSEEEIVFKYYQFIDASSGDEFASNMEEMANLALYDTGVTAVYGDKLLTLSTCDSSETDGRFVVVAKKKN